MDRKPPDQEPPVLDFEELLERCMGNIEFAERVLAKFQQRLGEDLEELEKGLHAEDAPAIARVAHRLKGASANVAARGVLRRAVEIEQLGRARRVSEIPSQVEELRREWARFGDSVSALRLSAVVGRGRELKPPHGTDGH